MQILSQLHRGVETKFACVSGSYALYDNTNWIRAGEADNKHALVVVSDIAKYILALLVK